MRLYPVAAAVGAGLLALASPSLSAKGWSGTAEFGLAYASGNSDSQTVNGRFDFKREEERWFYELNAAMLRAEDDGEPEANRYELGTKFGYLFSERFYGFGSLRYDNDDFSYYEWQTIASVGVGYHLIDSSTTKLTGELGPGLRRLQPVAEPTGVPPVLRRPGTESDAVIQGSIDFRHKLTATTTLSNLLLAESGGGSTYAENHLGVAVRMSERFALKAGYEVRYSTDVSPGVKKTDRLFTTNLVVGF